MTKIDGFASGNFSQDNIVRNRNKLIEELGSGEDEISKSIREDINAIYQQIEAILPLDDERTPEQLAEVISDLNQDAKILLRILVTKKENSFFEIWIEKWNNAIAKAQKGNFFQKVGGFAMNMAPSFAIGITALRFIRHGLTSTAGFTNAGAAAAVGGVVGGIRATFRESKKQFSPDGWLRSIGGENYQKAFLERSPEKIASKLDRGDIDKIEKVLAFLNKAAEDERNRLKNRFLRFMPGKDKEADLVKYMRVFNRLAEVRKILIAQPTTVEEAVLDEDEIVAPASIVYEPAIDDLSEDSDDKVEENDEKIEEEADEKLNTVLNNLIERDFKFRADYEKMIQTKKGKVFSASLKGAAVGALYGLGMVEAMGFLGEHFGGWIHDFYHWVINDSTHTNGLATVTNSVQSAHNNFDNTDTAYKGLLSDQETAAKHLGNAVTKTDELMHKAHDLLQKAAEEKQIDPFAQPAEGTVSNEIGNHPVDASHEIIKPIEPTTITTEGSVPPIEAGTPDVPPVDAHVIPTEAGALPDAPTHAVTMDHVKAEIAPEYSDAAEQPKLDVLSNHQVSDTNGLEVGNPTDAHNVVAPENTDVYDANADVNHDNAAIDNIDGSHNPEVGIGDSADVTNADASHIAPVEPSESPEYISPVENVAAGPVGGGSMHLQEVIAGGDGSANLSDINHGDIVKTEAFTTDSDGNDVNSSSLVESPVVNTDAIVDVPEIPVSTDLSHLAPAPVEIHAPEASVPTDLSHLAPAPVEIHAPEVSVPTDLSHLAPAPVEIHAPEASVPTDLSHLTPHPVDVDAPDDTVAVDIDAHNPETLVPDAGDVDVVAPSVIDNPAPHFDIGGHTDGTVGDLTPLPASDGPNLDRALDAQDHISSAEAGIPQNIPHYNIHTGVNDSNIINNSGGGGNAGTSEGFSDSKASGNLPHQHTSGLSPKANTPISHEKVENVHASFNEKTNIGNVHKPDIGNVHKPDLHDSGADKHETTNTPKEDKPLLTESVPEKILPLDQSAVDRAWTAFETNNDAGLAEYLKTHGIDLTPEQMQEMKSQFGLLKNFDDCKYLDGQMGENESKKLAQEIFKKLISDPTHMQERFDALRNFWTEENKLEASLNDLKDSADSQLAIDKDLPAAKTLNETTEAKIEVLEKRYKDIVVTLASIFGISTGAWLLGGGIGALNRIQAPKPSSLADKILGEENGDEDDEVDNIEPKTPDESIEYLKNETEPFVGEFDPAAEDGAPIFFSIKVDDKVTTKLTLANDQFVNPENLPRSKRDIECDNNNGRLLITSEIFNGESNGKEVKIPLDNNGLIYGYDENFDKIVNADFLNNKTKVILRPTAEGLKNIGFDNDIEGEFSVEDIDVTDPLDIGLRCSYEDANGGKDNVYIKLSDVKDEKNGFIWLSITEDALQKAIKS